MRNVCGISGVSGFDVSVSYSPEAALESARIAAPDAIVTRIWQPKDHIDGIVLTAAIKGDPSTRSIAVIVITTSILPARHEAAVAAGCDAYMVLPKTPDELASQIRAVLRTRSAKRLKPRPVRRSPKASDPKKAG